MQKNTVADIGLFTLRRNQRFMTIFRSPFKSLPIINDTKDGTIRSSSEGPTPKADNTLPVVCFLYMLPVYCKDINIFYA